MGVQVPLPAPTFMAKKKKDAEYDPRHNREEILRVKFGLYKYSVKFNAPYDAIDDYRNLFELKSTTKKSVSTSRDTSLKHIEKWRKAYWIFGFWDDKLSDFSSVYLLDQDDMKDWIDEREKAILTSLELCEKIKKQCKSFSPTEKKLLEHLLRRGSTLHDPNIPNLYIKSRGKIVKTKEDVDMYVQKRIIPPVGMRKFFVETPE